MKVLVVCLGNINRSPMCATILRKHGIDAESAALSYEGQPATKWARGVMQRAGHNIDQHRSRKVTQAMITDAEVVVCMNPSHAAKLSPFVKKAGNVLLQLGDFCEPKRKSIPDPQFLKAADPRRNEIAELIFASSLRLAHHLKGTK